MPCPYCGGSILGVGWGEDKGSYVPGTEWCRVICRRCSACGPSTRTENEAWEAWNARKLVDPSKLERHLKLCRRNLRCGRVVCCASCPFEKIIVGHDIGMAPLFDAKRKSRRGR